jgi:hypothetical protein
VGVKAGAGVAVGGRVAGEVADGLSVAIGLGVIGGVGGTLTHAANPINMRMSHVHCAGFISHVLPIQKPGCYRQAFDSIRTADPGFYDGKHSHTPFLFFDLSR